MIRALGLAILTLLLTAAPAAADELGDLKSRFRSEIGRPYAERIVTVQAIAALGTKEAARFLLKVVEEDEDSSIRLNTIHQVAKIEHRLVFDALLAIVRRGDSSRQSTAFHAIVYNRSEALPEGLIAKILAGSDQGLRSNTIRYLARRKDPRFIPEARRFLSDFPNSGTSLTSILVAAKTPDAARILLSLYDDSRRYDREQIPPVFAAGDEGVQQVLVETLKSPSRRLRLVAATVAGRGPFPEAEAALVAALPQDDTELRAVLVSAIGAVGAATPEGRAALLAALADLELEVRVAAARAIRKAPSRDAVPALIDLLEDEDRLLKAEVAVSLDLVTGQQYGDDIGRWRKWWAAYGAAFDPAAVKPREDGGLSQVLVDLAIERGAASLRGCRGKRPPWSWASHDAGTTALVVLALHAAGCTKRDKDLKAAIDFLLKSPVPEKTYETGLMAMALEAVGGKKYRRRLRECAKRLAETQLDGGLWGYPTGNGDNSNTQYAVLGLRAAARAGARVKERTWKAVRDHFLGCRGEDGGWAYTLQNRSHSSSSMTAAGVCCLLVCLENMELDDAESAELKAAIEAGYKALGTLMKLDKDTLYTLYGIERAGVLGSRATMAGQPWYVPGAKRLLEEQGRDGFWVGNYDRVVDTAFAILFLKRATVPIAAATR